MSFDDPEKLNGWYDLVWRLLQDLRSQSKKIKQSNLQNLENLFFTLRKIHKDYFRMFVRLYYALEAARTLEEVREAKENFRLSRERHSEERALLVSDASALVENQPSIAGKDFLRAVINYVNERQSLMPNQRLNSILFQFWVLMRENDERDILIDQTEEVIHRLSERFNWVMKAYAKVNPEYKVDKILRRGED